MTSIKGWRPESTAVVYRLEPPAVSPAVPPDTPQIEPDRAVAPISDPSTGSTVLAGLPPSSALRASLVAARKGREQAAAGGRSRTTARADAHGAAEAPVTELHAIAVSSRSSSRDRSSDDDAQQSSPWKTPARPAGAFLRSAVGAFPLPPTHMAGHALALPALCDAQASTQGMHSMPAYLRKTMQALVVDFVKDLADKIEYAASEKKVMLGADVVQPVREACDEFLRLMRPLYQRYAPMAALLSDACDVLCAAQPLLHREMLQRVEPHEELTRVMTNTVYPLLPVLVMGCMPRPGRGSRDADHEAMAA